MAYDSLMLCFRLIFNSSDPVVQLGFHPEHILNSEDKEYDILKKDILRRLFKHGKKANNLIKTVEFIIDRNF